MKIEINGHTVELEAFDPKLSAFFSENKPDFRALPQHVYDWNCRTQLGRPSPRPVTFTSDADMLFLVDDTMWKFYGIHGQRTRLELEELQGALKGFGLKSSAELQKHLDKIFKPQPIKIPYDVLLDPFLPGHSVAIYIEETYARWTFFYPGSMGPFFYFQVPVSYTFGSVVTDVCVKNPEIALKDGKRVSGKFELSEEVKKLVKEHEAALKKQRKEMKEFEEAEKKKRR